MISMILFITNLIIKFYNAFAIHKAIGKQASITKILLTGIFGIFLQTLTQLVAQIQEEEKYNNCDDNNLHCNMNNKSRKDKRNFRRHSTDITTNHNDDDELTEIYVDTNYKHYNTTIRRTENGLQLRTIDSPPKKQKPSLPERKYKQEPLRVETFKIEPLDTIKENKIQTLQPQLITPPTAYQCLGNNVTFTNNNNTAPIPSASIIQQRPPSLNNHSDETPLTINPSTPYELPQPSTTSTSKRLIPTAKLMDIQNPPPIDFEQLKLTANKTHNRSHSLDKLKMMTNHTRTKSHSSTLIAQIHTNYKTGFVFGEQLTILALSTIPPYILITPPLFLQPPPL